LTSWLICLVVYVIWYGNWTAASQSIITTFLSGLGSTSWWAINKAYGVRKIVFKKAVADTDYSQGKSLTLQKTWSVAEVAINKGLIPLNANAIYLVLSSR